MPSAAATARPVCSGATASWTTVVVEDCGASLKIQVHTPLSQPQNPEPEAEDEDEVPDGDALAEALVLVTGTFAAAEVADASAPAAGVVAAGVGDAEAALLLVSADGEALAEPAPAEGLDAVELVSPSLDALCPVGQTLGNGRVLLLVLFDAASAGVAT
jgi:hypothetical protein